MNKKNVAILLSILIVIVGVLVGVQLARPVREIGEGINFIKGHMGGNEIVLLYGDQVSKDMQKEEIISKTVPILNYPNIHGDQAVLLYRTKGENRIKPKIVDRSMKEYVPMCGGFTQVFGKALTETGMSKQLGIKMKEGSTDIILDTDAGTIPLKIIEGKTWTNMNSLLKYYYRLSVEPIKVGGVKATKVGYFLVINTDDIKEKYPFCDFEKMDEKTLETLVTLQKDWDKKYTPKGTNWWYFCLYDLHPEYGGDVRATFPHCIQDRHIEPSCGTGTTAIAVAIVERGELKKSHLLFEEGGSIGIGGPDLAETKMQIEDNKVIKLDFSHNFVEILAIGKLILHEPIGYTHQGWSSAMALLPALKSIAGIEVNERNLLT
jgi:diaminopimelate epimerase